MTQIVNPGGAFGYTDVQDINWQLVAPMKASADIAVNNVVAIGTAGAVAAAATDGTASLVVGMARDAISSGKTGLVVVMGVVDGLVAQGTIAAGDILKRSATTTGAVAATATPAAGEAIGVAMAASGGGVVKAWISKGLALS